jgi:hypothetical protein
MVGKARSRGPVTATTRMRNCPTIRAYLARRTAEGKTPARSAAIGSALMPTVAK